MKHIKMFRAALAALVTAAATLHLQAADIFVSPNGSGEKTGANWSNALNGSNDGWHIDVKTAITGAFAGGAEEVNVYLAAGDYTITNQITLSSISVPVKLSGGYVGTTDGDLTKGEIATTLKRNTSYNTRFINATSLSDLTIEGMSFSSGYVSGGGAKGGAILSASSTVVVSNCVFKDNGFKNSSKDPRNSNIDYLGGGGAIAATLGSLLIDECDFEGNYHLAGGTYNQSAGGAVLAYNASLMIKNSLFNGSYMNGASGRNTLFGGAVGTYLGNVSICNCTFSGNYIVGANAPPGGASGGALAIRNVKKFHMANSYFSNNYVACVAGSSGGQTLQFSGGILLLDDWKESDGIAQSVIERCVFDSRNVPGTKSSRPTQSDVLLSGGQLFMTNCVVTSARGDGVYGDYSVRNLRWSGSYAGNTSKYYGYIYSTVTCAPSDMELVNCTIADGKKLGAAAIGDGASLVVKNSIVSGNAVTGIENPTSVEYSCVQEEHEGVGNFVADPQWTGYPYYHLLTKNANGAITNGWFSGTFKSPKCAADSPCIDAGAPGSLGLDLEPYYSGRRVNIGAYGGTPWASKTSPLPGFKLIIR